MRLLLLDTATSQATVALTDDEVIEAEAIAQVSTHSERLLSLIDEVLHTAQVTLDQIQVLVCGAGPGSFTGLRIGLATAKGLCFATGKALIGCCSLDALGVAGAVEVSDSEQLVLALLDARRGQVYGGLYRGGIAVDPPFVKTIDQLALGLDRSKSILAIGDGALRYRQALESQFHGLTFANPDAQQIRAALLARGALRMAREGRFSDIAQAVPMYLRPPDLYAPAQNPAAQSPAAQSPETYSVAVHSKHTE